MEHRLHSKDNGVYIFVLEGNVDAMGEKMRPRDGMGVSETASVSITAEGPARVLLMEGPMERIQTRSGKGGKGALMKKPNEKSPESTYGWGSTGKLGFPCPIAIYHLLYRTGRKSGKNRDIVLEI